MKAKCKVSGISYYSTHSAIAAAVNKTQLNINEDTITVELCTIQLERFHP